MKRGPSKSGSSPDVKSLKKSEDSRVQNHSSDSDVEALEDPGEVQNPDVPVNVESADNSRKVENSDAPENVANPVIPENEEHPVIPENVENSDMPGNVENQDRNENAENQNIYQNVENEDIHQNVENEDIHQNVENQDIHQNMENQDIYQIVENSEDSGNSSIGDPERHIVVINGEESEESPSARESDASPESSERDASAESSERDASAESSERGASAEPSERDASVESSERGASTEPSERDASVEPSERDASAEPAERNASAEPSERNASAEPSERDASGESSERDASAESSERDASAEPSEGDASAEPSERDASAEPSETEASAEPSERYASAEPSERYASAQPSERYASAQPSESEAPGNRPQLLYMGDLAFEPREPRCDPEVCADCLNNIDYYGGSGARTGITAIDKAESLKVLCVGQCCLDLVKTCENFPTEHSINSCTNFRYQRGGSASNVCTVLRIMNQPTEYFGVLSNGPFSGFLEDDLRECNVDFSHCRRREDLFENPASVVILSKATQSQTIIHYNQNYPEETDKNFYDICLCRQTWVHFEGRNVEESLKMMYTIMGHNDRIRVINKVAHQTGLLHVPVNISVELKRARVGVMELVAHAHVVFVTEQFARSQRLESIGDTIRYIRQYTMQNTVILSYWGERGAMGYAATGEIVQSPSFINPNWVDPLGSQDVFTAAVIHFLNQEKISGLRDAPDEEPEPIQQKVQHLHSCFDRDTVQRACTFGCQCAGVKVGFVGFEGLRTRYGAYLDE